MILYRINKQQKINKITDYSVRKSLQLKENDISIRLLLPLSASHTLLFTCYLVLYTSLKFAFDSADGLSYAAAVEGAHLVCLFLVWAFRKVGILKLEHFVV
ncbi:unnamed protein product [Meloidogyne enterolobii]|uniref:Uncharacterized protein n=1 Tax=Meloidogyne enterolobii TaxID=390850 RepID=A0ACB1A0K6_MELEN